MTSPAIAIRVAVESDVPLIHDLIRGLAEYERLSQAVTATPERLKQTLFGPRPAAEVLIADVLCQTSSDRAGEADAPGSCAAGFALFFQNYSTFLAQSGIYLEDLFVRPAHRGKGIGRKLLARLASIARERQCGRMEWAVLDWNEPAIGFYQSLGAKPMNEWRIFRLTGDALGDLAE